MKNILPVLILVVGIGLAVWYFKNQKPGDLQSDCIEVNRIKFPVQWDEEKIPGGTLAELAQNIFGSTESEVGSIIGGFFKGIDVYPSKNAGKYYQQQIIKYYNSPNGLPRWNVQTGELLCNN